MLIDRRALRILDVLFVLTMAAQLLTPNELLPEDPQRSAAYWLLIAAAVVLWIVWRRSGRGWSLVALTVLSLIAPLLGDGPVPLILVAFSLVIVVVVRGPRAGVAITVFLVLGGIGSMALVYHRDAAFIAVQMAVIIAALGIVWLIAALLRLLVVASHEAQEAHRALAASVETEKELLLARERTREAGELHDGLGHRLTAIGLLLNAGQRLRETDPDKAWQTVEEARVAAVDALGEMRVYVRALHPVSVDSLGDADAFAAIADRFRGTGLDVEVDAQVTGLDERQALIVRRCVQEGLTNVARHADAQRVQLTVRQDDVGVRVEIDDDGSGDAGALPGFGLTELRRRVEELGGTLTIGSSSLGGLRLSVEVPS